MDDNERHDGALNTASPDRIRPSPSCYRIDSWNRMKSLQRPSSHRRHQAATKRYYFLNKTYLTFTIFNLNSYSA